MDNYTPKSIYEIASSCGISNNNVIPYGKYMAKIDYDKEKENLNNSSKGNLVVVTSINPTKSGEGKTCTAIGLTQALGKIGENVSLCLREPSLGPIFGIKGGATGNNKAQVIPSEEINLHFTGDMHAITAAHNLLASVVDNHVVKGNSLNVDPKRILWNRALDINDRELRYVILGLKKKSRALKRSTGFIITAASEIMAILALSKDIGELRKRLGEMIVAYDRDGRPLKCKQFNVVGSLVVLLRNAIKPNLVQTIEGQPVFIHAGPFANIAHGNNSVIATELSLLKSDVTVTESGFGADLGMEKLFDIVVPQLDVNPSGVVIVVSARALKNHGGVNSKNVNEKNIEVLRKGLKNLEHHIEIVKSFGITPVIAINKFPNDHIEELEIINSHCENMGIPSAISEVVAKGSEGGKELAELVLENLGDSVNDFSPCYNKDMPIKEKIEAVATEIYGAEGVEYSEEALKDIKFLYEHGFGELPVNIAKTHLSLSNNSKKKNVPKSWKLRVSNIKPAAGAGFLVVFTGKIRLMPGLPKQPAAEKIDLTADGDIVGLMG